MPFALRIDGTLPVRLEDFSAADTDGMDKARARLLIRDLGQELAELEDLLFFAGRHALLVVLQGRDTSGKDGVIRRILGCTNAQSCRVEPFKAPTAEEQSRDFLWRVHARVPARGSMVIFNRSHYEDVLAARVRELVPEATWQRRYGHINQFETLLQDHDTVLLKFFLHISHGEQERRLRAREEKTEKAWKLSVGDWKDRALWDAYSSAYQDVLNRCSSLHAPWFLVPADRKWFRDLAVLEQIVQALRPLRAGWLASLDERGRQAMAEIRAYREKTGKSGKSAKSGKDAGKVAPECGTPG